MLGQFLLVAQLSSTCDFHIQRKPVNCLIVSFYMYVKTKDDMKSRTSTTFVDVVLSEDLDGTFDGNLLHPAAPAELEFTHRRVFGQDVAQFQAIRVDV